MQLYLFRNILGFFLLYNIQPKNAKYNQKNAKYNQKNPKKYYYELWYVIRNKLSEYNKNLLTKKHKMVKYNQKTPNTTKKRPIQQKNAKNPNILCAIKFHSKLSVYMKMDNL